MKKLLLYLFLITAGLISTVQVSAQKEIAPGVIKLQKGEIDTFTPYSLFGGKPVIEAMKALPAAKLPFDAEDVQIKITDRGTNLRFRTSIRNFRSARSAQTSDSK